MILVIHCNYFLVPLWFLWSFQLVKFWTLWLLWFISGATFISHDLTGPINVKQPTDYSHTLNYQASSNQLIELTSLSANCRQLMRLQCKNFPLWDNVAGEMKGWLVNVDGQKMNNWPGVPVEDFGCNCGKGTFQLYIPFHYTSTKFYVFYFSLLLNQTEYWKRSLVFFAKFIS